VVQLNVTVQVVPDCRVLNFQFQDLLVVYKVWHLVVIRFPRMHYLFGFTEEHGLVLVDVDAIEYLTELRLDLRRHDVLLVNSVLDPSGHLRLMLNVELLLSEVGLDGFLEDFVTLF